MLRPSLLGVPVLCKPSRYGERWCLDRVTRNEQADSSGAAGEALKSAHHPAARFQLFFNDIMWHAVAQTPSSSNCGSILQINNMATTT